MFDYEDEFKMKEYMEKVIDKDKKFQEFFRKAVVELDGVVMALIVDAFLENYMKQHGIKELTKIAGRSDLKRTYFQDDVVSGGVVEG
jgi:hypothetical protein|tara:strand:+ start:1006 stop:1266 length:261 start_codon:yes stop_codon:yes gene_type:complete